MSAFDAWTARAMRLTDNSYVERRVTTQYARDFIDRSTVKKYAAACGIDPISDAEAVGQLFLVKQRMSRGAGAKRAIGKMRVRN